MDTEFSSEPSLADHGMGAFGSATNMKTVKAKLPFSSAALKETIGQLNVMKGILQSISNLSVNIGNKLLGALAGKQWQQQNGYLPNPSATQQQNAQQAGGQSNAAAALQPGAGGPNGPNGPGGGGGPGGGNTGWMNPGKYSAAQLFAIRAGFEVADAASSAVGNRIQRGYSYSLAADKMSVMYQQLTGLSQQGVQTAYRQPLTNYRIGGLEAANQILAFQASTGLTGQARSVEAMRTMTGFGMSTPDALNAIGGLADPAVANRMFMTTGMSIFGVGGQENSALSVIQNLVNKAGLNNSRVIKSGLRAGSVTRAQLSYMGVPEDMQDLVLQYAQENVTYQNKGGKGMYDPSSRSGQALMGINNNFATQAEETMRTKNMREEEFYRKQADNFAEMEKVTQSLTKAFGALENSLGGLIGMGISSGGVGQMLGSMGTTAGMLLTMAGQPQFGIPLALGSMFFGKMAGGGGTGDPVYVPGGTTTQFSSSYTMKVPTYGGSTTFGEMASRPTVTRLQPSFREALFRMIRDSKGRVGIGQGWRSQEAQTAEFLKRYRKATGNQLQGMLRDIAQENSGKSPADIKAAQSAWHSKNVRMWNGEPWILQAGNAPLASPGNSMHEYGLAADLVGDLGWVAQNAGKYGLRTFGGSKWGDEPWHVQPINTEGMVPKGVDVTGLDTQGGSSEFLSGDVGAGGDGRMSSVASYASGGNLGVAEKLGIASTEALASFQSGGGGGVGRMVARRNIGAGGLAYTPSGVLSAQQLVSLLQAQGFTGDDLKKAVGISWRESRWNPQAMGDSNTSYGLFQIKMNDGLGERRRAMYGLSSNSQLLDAATSARVAYYEMVTRRNYFPWFSLGDGTGWNAKGVETAGWDPPISTMDQAGAVIQQATTGDPVASYTPSRSAGITPTNISGDTVVNISPTVNIVSSGAINGDLTMVAKEIGRLLEHEVRMKIFRSN